MDGAVALGGFLDSIETLTVFRGVRDDAFVRKMAAFARAVSERERGREAQNIRALLYDAAAELVERAEELGLGGDIYRRYMARLFLNDENPFSLACERGETDKGLSVFKLAKRDMERLAALLSVDLQACLRRFGGNEDLTAYRPANHVEDAYLDRVAAGGGAEETLNALCLYYGHMGAGEMARFRAFKYAGNELRGVPYCDETTLADIVGYEEQKRMLVDNTESFLNGRPANNVLLVGARGTGKSSCVKALYNEYHAQGLRVIEMAKDNLERLSDVARLVRGRGMKFIVFIDDLSFDDFEAQYKHMKSLIEGGVEATPTNMLFYATSNRRHIVAERWSDRDGAWVEDGEVHASDAMNEKLSLSDRFGLTISFDKPSPTAYVDIVKSLANKYGLDMPSDTLEEQARQWELSHHGLSGRSAKQFVNHLICEAYR